jgi:hypothetical protein
MTAAEIEEKRSASAEYRRLGQDERSARLQSQLT